MLIETKYEIGQEVFVQEDGEWIQGKITGWAHNGNNLHYEIYSNELYGYFRIPEKDITIDKPDGFQKVEEFLDFFPEFDEHERHELSFLLKRLRKQSAGRVKKSA